MKSDQRSRRTGTSKLLVRRMELSQILKDLMWIFENLDHIIILEVKVRNFSKLKNLLKSDQRARRTVTSKMDSLIQELRYRALSGTYHLSELENSKDFRSVFGTT